MTEDRSRKSPEAVAARRPRSRLHQTCFHEDRALSSAPDRWSRTSPLLPSQSSSSRHTPGRAPNRQKALDFGAAKFVDLDNDALEDVGGVDPVFDVIGRRYPEAVRGHDPGRRNPGDRRRAAGGTARRWRRSRLRCQSDRAQLGEMVQRPCRVTPGTAVSYRTSRELLSACSFGASGQRSSLLPALPVWWAQARLTEEGSAC